MDNPLISIIIPVYNVEDYIRPCLDSILTQTYTHFEAILVDDGSKDGSGRICDEYAEKDSRFVVVHKDNEGVAKARITAFDHSKGELITFIDSDDYVSPLYLEKLAKPIIEDDADMVSCDFYRATLDGTLTINSTSVHGIYDGPQIKDFITNHYFYDKETKGWGMSLFISTKMVRRFLVVDALKEGDGLWFGEDQISVFSMMLKSKRIVVIPQRLYYYVIRDNQATSIYNDSLWESLLKMFEKYETLDESRLLSNGFRNRVWIYVMSTIFNKMTKNGLKFGEFRQHIRNVRNSSYMKRFFKPFSVDFGWKDNVKYWFLKLKQYSLFYFLFVKRKM